MTDTRDPSASDGRWSDTARRAGPATPAATVMVLRDAPQGPEVLMLRRSRGGAFSGMWVFPGGRVEPADLAAAGITEAEVVSAGGAVSTSVGERESEIAAACHAAVREAQEEAALRLNPADLVVHSHWQPPLEASRRFSTWFFVVGVDATTEVKVDLAEVHEYRWITAARAMAERDAGVLPLATPTWMTLWQLAKYPDVASVLTAARDTSPPLFATRLVRGGDALTFVWPGDAAYEDGELDRPGRRRRLTAPDDGPWQAQMSGGATSDTAISDTAISDAGPSEAGLSDAGTADVRPSDPVTRGA